MRPIVRSKTIVKRIVIASCLIVGATGAGLVWFGRGISGTLAVDKTPSTAPSTQPALGVEELMKHVDGHREIIVVEGVTSAASPSDQQQSLIDRHEFEECGLAGCAAYVLPVRWSGAMPAVKDIVRISGEVKDAGNGKLVFVAISVEDGEPAVEGKEEGNGK